MVFCAEQPYTPNERKLSALDRDERTIWIVDAHRDDGKHFVVCNYLRIHDSISDYGVVKMNVDTDMQYAFTRAVAGHMFKNYDGVLKVDGEVGNKKVYDPRAYLALAETAMAERVKQGASDLCASGKATFAS